MFDSPTHAKPKKMFRFFFNIKLFFLLMLRIAALLFSLRFFVHTLLSTFLELHYIQSYTFYMRFCVSLLICFALRLFRKDCRQRTKTNIASNWICIQNVKVKHMVSITLCLFLFHRISSASFLWFRLFFCRCVVCLFRVKWKKKCNTHKHLHIHCRCFDGSRIK